MRISDWSSDVCSSDLVAPLVRAGLLPPDWPYICHAVSGYSGGGKALIERFEQDRDIAWRGYALTLGHKHVPEMQARCGLSIAPLFSPAVDRKSTRLNSRH